MPKRPRCMLGLWAFLGWHAAPIEGFVSPMASRVHQGIREASEKLAFSHNSIPSTCHVLFAEGGGAGEERSVDYVRDRMSQSTSDDSVKHDAACPAADSTNGTVCNMSLSELLAELDRRDIRYSPSANRSDLECLLQNIHQTSITYDLSLQELIDELDRRDIRYPPTASRRELQVLLASADVNHPRSFSVDVEKKTKTEHLKYSKITVPLAELLEELDKKNIRYPPTASRKQLEALLLHRAMAPGNQRQNSTSTSSVTVNPSSPQRSVRDNNKGMDKRTEKNVPPSSQAVTSSGPPRSHRRMPLNVLLAELDRLNIRFSPTASRAELEMLLKKAFAEERLHEERRQRRRLEKEKSDDSIIKDILQKSTRVAIKSVQKLPRKVSRLATSSYLTGRVSGVAERAARQAKRVSRRAADFWNEDENGIRDVDFEYISVDRPIDVPAVRLDEEEPRRASAPRATRPPRERHSPPSRAWKPRTYAARQAPANWQMEERVRKQRRPRYPESRQSSANRVPKQRRQKRPISRQRVEDSLGPSSLLLPPTSPGEVPLPNVENFTSVAGTPNQTVTVTPNESEHQTQKLDVPKKESKKRKRIYSPYTIDDDGEIEGPFDRIGEFIADSADRMLWGPVDNGDGDTAQVRKEKQNDGERQRTQGDSSKKRKPRYWKDRLAEHVDYALGIHEDGKYYNSWETQLEEEEARREREGPQFWERNNPSSRKRQSSSNRRAKYSAPLWEEDGNIVSFILGRTKSGEKLGVEVSY